MTVIAASATKSDKKSSFPNCFEPKEVFIDLTNESFDTGNSNLSFSSSNVLLDVVQKVREKTYQQVNRVPCFLLIRNLVRSQMGANP